MAISASRIAIMPNSKAPAMPPTAAPSGMKVKNTSMPLYPSKLVVLKISTQASPAPIPSAAPPHRPQCQSQQSQQRDLHASSSAPISATTPVVSHGGERRRPHSPHH